MSNRTHQRAAALATLRGCGGLGDCWQECYEAALGTIVNGDMTEWERANLGRVMARLYGPRA